MMLENYGTIHLAPSLFTQWVNNLRDAMNPSQESLNGTGFASNIPSSSHNNDGSLYFWCILFPLFTAISLRIAGLPSLLLAWCKCMNAKKEESLAAKLDEVQSDLKKTAGTEAVEKIQAGLKKTAGTEAVEKIQAGLKELAGKAAVEKIQANLKELAGTEAVEKIQAGLKELAGKEGVEKIQANLKKLAGKAAVEKIQANLKELAGKEAVEKIQANLKELAGKEALERIQAALNEQNRKFDDLMKENESLQQQLQQINNAVFILIGRDGKDASERTNM